MDELYGNAKDKVYGNHKKGEYIIILRYGIIYK